MKTKKQHIAEVEHLVSIGQLVLDIKKTTIIVTAIKPKKFVNGKFNY